MKQRRSAKSRGKVHDTRASTRAHLLEIAGQVFAEKGYDAATGKEICELAGANAAAVVYHFGGMGKLYAAVLREARDRLFSRDMLSKALIEQRDPKLKLEALVRLAVAALTGPASGSWATRVIGREMLSPSKVLEKIGDRQAKGRVKILASVVSELTGLPATHPAVAHAAVSIMAPCGMLLIVNRQRLKRAFPSFCINADSVEEITQHMTQFALAGVAAIARQART